MFDYNKILETHGPGVLESIQIYKDEIIKNLNYLEELGFEDNLEILESYPSIFICTTKEFQIKINSLISILDEDYIELLEENMDLWQSVL